MNNLIEIIDNLNSKTNGIHFYLEDTYLTYYEIHSLIKKFSFYLKQQGIKKDDKVILNLQPKVEHIVTFLSLIYIGAVPISVKPKFGSDDYYENYLINLAKENGAKWFFHDILSSVSGFGTISFCTNTINEYIQINEIMNDSLAFIQFSSGSTSSPKAIKISHKNILHNIKMISEVDSRTEQSIGLNFLPLSHDMGLVGGLLSNLYLQNVLHLTSVDIFLRKMPFYLDLIYTQKINVTAMPNFILSYLSKRLAKMKIKNDKLLSSLSTVYVGAEPIRKQTIESFIEVSKNFGFKQSALLFSYGMAETTLMTTSHRFKNIQESFDQNKHGEFVACVGKAIENMSILINSKDMIGDIYINGLSVVTNLAQHKIGNQMYLDTGDIGYLKNNELYIYGRKKDMIIVNGENIYLLDIENHLNSLLSPMLQCDDSSIAIPYEESFVVLINSKKAIDDYIFEYALSSLVNTFSVKPKYIRHISSDLITKTTSGKIMKEATINTLLQHQGGNHIY